ncbi:hypothetical protein JCGZ_17800 [Jatropha curcas]|uniref:LysM domain-containing protein n=1 Tax=Jatropha curcas TaxID=180498 RepID=A0A067JRX0_JATCU|nr:hypothetical protein JCGZ_17800 [Jatropha curcas]
MASRNLLPYLLPLLATLLSQAFAFPDNMYPFNCLLTTSNCNSLLYHINKGLEKEQIASFYNVSTTQIFPVFRGDQQDYFIAISSSCKNINGTRAYFYDAPYTVQENDTFFEVSEQIYSGQAWRVGDEESKFIVGNVVTMHLLSGCAESNSQVVATYTVQQNDTISYIANTLSSTVSGIVEMNSALIKDPNLLNVGWVLFVPIEQPEPIAPAPSPTYA